MSLENRLLFIATPGGKSHAIVMAYIAECQACHDARSAYCKQLNADAYHAGWGISALLFKPEVTLPDGYRIDEKRGRHEGMVYAVPNRKVAAGKARVKELESLPGMPDAMRFSRLIGFPVYIKGRAMLQASYGKIGESYIISIPKMDEVTESDLTGNLNDVSKKKASQFIPPDCTPLKLSEYYAMKEAEEAKQAAAKASAPQPEPVTT